MANDDDDIVVGPNQWCCCGYDFLGGLGSPTVPLRSLWSLSSIDFQYFLSR